MSESRECRLERVSVGSMAGILVLLSVFSVLPSCYPIPERSQGLDLFPLFRYAHSEEDQSRELDLLWPLVHVRDHGEAFYQAWFFPFYFRTKDPLRDDLTLVPLFGVRRHALTTRIDLLPFLLDSVASVSIAEDSTLQRHHVSGLRLLFNEMDQVPGGIRLRLLDLLGLVHLLDLDTGRVSFPGGPADLEPAYSLSFVKVLELVELFQCSNEGAYTDVLFLELAGNEPISLFRYHRRHTGGERLGDGETHLFPFYFSGSSEGGKSGYRHFWPLYGIKWDDPDYLKRYFLYPVLSLEGAASRDLRGFELLWPLVGYRREAGSSRLTLLGLVPWSWGTPSDTPSDTPGGAPAGTGPVRSDAGVPGEK